MKFSDCDRHATSVAWTVVLAALLSACSTHAGNGSVPAVNSRSDASASRNTRTFKYTGRKQMFKVPTGVTTIQIRAFGASGGDSTGGEGTGSAGGNGGVVRATIPVTPSEELAIFVGGVGRSAGGFNGGARGGSTSGSGGFGGGGGGASDLRRGGALTRPRDRRRRWWRRRWLR
jgi:hypothetical protein